MRPLLYLLSFFVFTLFLGATYVSTSFSAHTFSSAPVPKPLSASIFICSPSFFPQCPPCPGCSVAEGIGVVGVPYFKVGDELVVGPAGGDGVVAHLDGVHFLGQRNGASPSVLDTCVSPFSWASRIFSFSPSYFLFPLRQVAGFLGNGRGLFQPYFLCVLFGIEFIHFPDELPRLFFDVPQMVLHLLFVVVVLLAVLCPETSPRPLPRCRPKTPLRPSKKQRTF